MDIRTYIENETGIPTADVAFTKPQKLPFIAVLDRTDEDGDEYHARIVSHDLVVEFYTERIDAGREKRIEAAFEKQAWKISKERIWLNTEKMFETVYRTNFIEKREKE